MARHDKANHGLCTAVPNMTQTQNSPMISFPQTPFEKIGSDIFTFDKKNYLLTIDYDSRLLTIDYDSRLLTIDYDSRFFKIDLIRIT